MRTCQSLLAEATRLASWGLQWMVFTCARAQGVRVRGPQRSGAQALWAVVCACTGGSLPLARCQPSGLVVSPQQPASWSPCPARGWRHARERAAGAARTLLPFLCASTAPWPEASRGSQKCRLPRVSPAMARPRGRQTSRPYSMFQLRSLLSPWAPQRGSTPPAHRRTELSRSRGGGGCACRPAMTRARRRPLGVLAARERSDGSARAGEGLAGQGAAGRCDQLAMRRCSSKSSAVDGAAGWAGR